MPEDVSLKETDSVKVMTDLINAASAWIDSHLLTWEFSAQVVLLILLSGLAFSAHIGLKPRLKALTATWPPNARLIRFKDVFIDQTGPILLLVLIFLLRTILQQASTVSLNQGLLIVVVSLLGAWVVIRLFSALIENRFIANTIAFLAWAVASLNILGLLDPTLSALNAVGVPMGGGQITLLSLVNGIILLGLLIWAGMYLGDLVDHQLAGAMGVSARARVLVGKILRFILIALAVLISLSTVGINLTALAVFTGAIGVGIGIGLQHQVSNLMSGLFLLLDKSVKPGDVIEVGETFGWVKEMSARYVGVVTRDNKEILIPNDTFVQNQVINWSHSDRSIRMEVTFGVSYASDPHKVREISAAAARGIDRIADTPAPICHLIVFGESSIDFSLRFWIKDPENGVTNVKGAVFLALWDTFKEHGVEIPFPHRYIIQAKQP